MQKILFLCFFLSGYAFAQNSVEDEVDRLLNEAFTSTNPVKVIEKFDSLIKKHSEHPKVYYMRATLNWAYSELKEEDFFKIEKDYLKAYQLGNGEDDLYALSLGSLYHAVDIKAPCVRSRKYLKLAYSNLGNLKRVSWKNNFDNFVECVMPTMSKEKKKAIFLSSIRSSGYEHQFFFAYFDFLHKEKDYGELLLALEFYRSRTPTQINPLKYCEYMINVGKVVYGNACLTIFDNASFME